MSTKTTIIVDFSNMFHRMKHQTMKGASESERVGMVMHQMFTGIRSAWKKFDADCCILALEGKSWRKKVYPAYKMNRIARKLKRKPSEIEADEVFEQAANDLIEYFSKDTNIPAIKSPNAEADDIIATFIFDRPDEQHIIVSCDSDFHQLIADNVMMYDPMQGHIITINGVFNDRMQPVIDKTTKKQKTIGDPEYILFKKCIRGDSSDNISSAYPKIREKGSKNKVGIVQCFEDRKSKGFEWNTVMLHEWEDHMGNRNKVKDLYERNRLLIDLREIPDIIVEEVRQSIVESCQKKVSTSEVGFKFMKFCAKYELVNLSQHPGPYTEFLGKRYV